MIDHKRVSLSDIAEDRFLLEHIRGNVECLVEDNPAGGILPSRLIKQDLAPLVAPFAGYSGSRRFIHPSGTSHGNSLIPDFLRDENRTARRAVQSHAGFPSGKRFEFFDFPGSCRTDLVLDNHPVSDVRCGNGGADGDDRIGFIAGELGKSGGIIRHFPADRGLCPVLFPGIGQLCSADGGGAGRFSPGKDQSLSVEGSLFPGEREFRLFRSFGNQDQILTGGMGDDDTPGAGKQPDLFQIGFLSVRNRLVNREEACVPG